MADIFNLHNALWGISICYLSACVAVTAMVWNASMSILENAKEMKHFKRLHDELYERARRGELDFEKWPEYENVYKCELEWNKRRKSS